MRPFRNPFRRFPALRLYGSGACGRWKAEQARCSIPIFCLSITTRLSIRTPARRWKRCFYITSRGVHNLRGRSSQLISRQIERYTGELTEYLKTAQICFQFKYGDLIVYNPEYPYAYVYSLASGFWSSRDMTGRILNNGQIIMRGAIALLGDETMSCSVDCRIVTRPLEIRNDRFQTPRNSRSAHHVAGLFRACDRRRVERLPYMDNLARRLVSCRRYGRTLSAYFYVVQIPAVQTASDGQRAVVDDRCGCRVVSSLYETVAVGALHSVTKRDESHCARSEIICQNFRLCLKNVFLCKILEYGRKIRGAEKV